MNLRRPQVADTDPEGSCTLSTGGMLQVRESLANPMRMTVKRKAEKSMSLPNVTVCFESFLTAAAAKEVLPPLKAGRNARSQSGVPIVAGQKKSAPLPGVPAAPCCSAVQLFSCSHSPSVNFVSLGKM